MTRTLTASGFPASTSHFTRQHAPPTPRRNQRRRTTQCTAVPQTSRPETLNGKEALQDKSAVDDEYVQSSACDAPGSGSGITDERTAVSSNGSNGSSGSIHASTSSNGAAKSVAEDLVPPSVAEYSNGRFEEAAARPDPRVAQVALDPAATPLLDLNAATFSGGGPNRITLSDLILNDGGPPRFIQPFIPGRASRPDQATLPLLVYLPGIDGTGLAASRQFPYLVDAFDLHCLSVPSADRTPFGQLVSLVEKYLEAVVGGSPPDRPAYLLGESFGGVLALAVAHARPDLVDRVVLVNPATSFPRSVWPALGPLLPRVPKELYQAVPVALAPVLGNPLALAAFGVDRTAPLPDQAAALAQGLAGLLPQLAALSDILPPPTLAWKLQLLEEGNRDLAPKLKDVGQRVLLLVGDADWLIPSADEGARLQKQLQRCRLRVMPGRSHALLQEAGVNLVALMREEGFYVERRVMSSPGATRGRGGFGEASPIELPTPQELSTYADKAYVTTIRRLVSPVFFSRAAGGAIQQGLAGIPDDRPLLFVGNHQTFALDLGLFVEEILRQRRILPRGLAHPAIFEPANNGGQDVAGFKELMTTFGAVKVGGRNFFRLLKNGEAVLLFPGGVREAYKGKGEEYRLFWSERPEFVRMAARYGATIVPFAGVGAEDGFQMLLEPEEIRRLPVLGAAIEARARRQVPQARRGVAENKALEDLFIAPFAVPKPPSRFYYVFQEPVRTSPDDLKDPARIAALYRQVKGSVESGIEYLLQKREGDPYREPLPRWLYEAASGGKQAPTFRL